MNKKLLVCFGVLMLFIALFSIEDAAGKAYSEGKHSQIKRGINAITIPSGANIYIDNVFKGVTPKKVKCAAGLREVKFTKQGYEDYITRVKVPKKRVITVEAVLTPLEIEDTTPPVIDIFNASRDRTNANRIWVHIRAHDFESGMKNMSWSAINLTPSNASNASNPQYIFFDGTNCNGQYCEVNLSYDAPIAPLDLELFAYNTNELLTHRELTLELDTTAPLIDFFTVLRDANDPTRVVVSFYTHDLESGIKTMFIEARYINGGLFWNYTRSCGGMQYCGIANFSFVGIPEHFWVQGGVSNSLGTLNHIQAYVE